MLLLKSFKKIQIGRWCSPLPTIPPQTAEPPFTFITRGGLPPLHSHVCWTPWSVLQDGSDDSILSASWAWCRWPHPPSDQRPNKALHAVPHQRPPTSSKPPRQKGTCFCNLSVQNSIPPGVSTPSWERLPYNHQAFSWFRALMLTNRDAKYQLNGHSRNQTTTPPRKRLPPALCCSIYPFRLDSRRTISTEAIRFHFNNFKPFWLSFQSTFHLSLTLLVRYRSQSDI